jgi:hypothetical protein
MTGAGMPINRVVEIDVHLKREYDDVRESLIRLHNRD